MSGSITDRITRHVTEALGSEPQRASVTFLGVEPIDVLRFVDGDDPATAEVVFVSVGCARHPMHDPTDLAPDPVAGPRAEVVVRLAAGHTLAGLHRQLATVAAAPAVEGLILAPDALVDLSEPLWTGSAASAFLLEPDQLAPLESEPPVEAVTFLRAVPITANEAAWVRLHGADALREAWEEAGIDIADPARAAARPRKR